MSEPDEPTGRDVRYGHDFGRQHCPAARHSGHATAAMAGAARGRGIAYRLCCRHRSSDDYGRDDLTLMFVACRCWRVLGHRRVAVAENTAGEIVYRWNSDAAGYSPASEFYICVYQRKL